VILQASQQIVTAYLKAIRDSQENEGHIEGQPRDNNHYEKV
jgi:hypothetical protein